MTGSKYGKGKVGRNFFAHGIDLAICHESMLLGRTHRGREKKYFFF